jgi:hypothetical protein
VTAIPLTPRHGDEPAHDEGFDHMAFAGAGVSSTRVDDRTVATPRPCRRPVGAHFEGVRLPPNVASICFPVSCGDAS